MSGTLLSSLEAWRVGRDPKLAADIDAIPDALPPLETPRGRAVHRWWMTKARRYDPESVGVLVATASVRANQTDDVTWSDIQRDHGHVAVVGDLDTVGGGGFAFRQGGLNVIDRFAAMCDWPDDPRMSALLASWLIEAPYRWDPIEHADASQVFYRGVAERLARLGDVRVLGELRACMRSPRAPTATLRRLQQEVLPAMIASLEARAPVEHAKAPKGDEQPLWRAIAERPADLAARGVLADFLLERGDPRGELIALQLGGKSADQKAKALIRKHWNAWLGDVALVANRNGTKLVNGMLEVVRVGTPRTPEWAFTRVHGHRELATVHTLLSGHVRPEHFAAFAADRSMPLVTLGVDAPETIDALALARERWQVRRIHYSEQSVRDYYRREFPPIEQTLLRIAALAPDLEELVIERDVAPHHAKTFEPALRALHARLPRLRVVDAPR
jgi:uncharacterized protein (TIGR02996 family)